MNDIEASTVLIDEPRIAEPHVQVAPVTTQPQELKAESQLKHLDGIVPDEVWTGVVGPLEVSNAKSEVQDRRSQTSDGARRDLEHANRNLQVLLDNLQSPDRDGHFLPEYSGTRLMLMAAVAGVETSDIAECEEFAFEQTGWGKRRAAELEEQGNRLLLRLALSPHFRLLPGGRVERVKPG